MLRTRLSILLCAACAPVFVGCPTDSRRDTFDYLRSPVTFRIDPIAADHPFCFDSEKRPDGMSEAECRATSKYRLRWDRPEDTVGFAEYRVYLDTTPPNSALSWSEVRKDRTLAAFVLEGLPSPADSILFVLSGSGTGTQYLTRGEPRITRLDTTGRLDASRFVFSIVTAYNGGGIEGQPRYTWVITDDKFAPYPPQPRITPAARGMTLQWERPRDPTSFFEPGADSGIVLAYYLRVIRGGILNTNRPGNFDSVRIASYRVGSSDRTAEVDSVHFVTARGAPGRLFRLPDSARARNNAVPGPADSLRVILEGFTPQDTVDIGLWAVDAAGNYNRVDSSAFTRMLLTDTTKPVTPQLRALDSTRNGFVYAFTASRDLVPSGSGTVPASMPNANILEYRVTRVPVGGTTSGSGTTDTVIAPSTEQRGDTLFTDTVRYLAPGAAYRLYVRAVDSSGHVSDPDSLDIATTSSRFPGADSALSCPPGFIAVPGGSFLRGDTSSAAAADEKPASLRHMESFCIEPREHRTAGGAFAVRATWTQARDACADVAGGLTPADSTWLCTEAEWERACEGAQPDVPLTYGMQSEKKSPGNVRFACNIGTGDSAMAADAALRDPACITYDGAFDMSGNLAEWVLDGHLLQSGTSALAPYPATSDTLSRGAPHTSPNTAGAVRGFRGSHYLNPNQSVTTLLARARCSNRDYASQSRPRPYPGCTDSTGPQIVVIYNQTSKAPRCLPLPQDVTAGSIASISTARDSTQLLLLLSGQAEPRVYQMPADTAYASAKPVSAALTQRTMAIVTFRNAQTLETITDTLSAAELLNASPAGLDAIFAREAAAPWAGVKEGGQYAIRYVYAYVQTRSIPAKAYYSNSALGYRCCAKPRP